VTNTIERANAGASETPLTLKLGKFQRGLIEPGLHKREDDRTRDARAIMNALFIIQCEQDPSLKLLKYSEFAADPLGH
jgi:hypothetical protein